MHCACCDSVCAVPKGHRLARRRVLTPTDLADEALIMLGRGGDTRMRIEDAFRAQGIVPKVHLEAHSVGAACAFVAAGVGFSIVAEFLARDQRHRGIELRPFRPEIPQEYVFLTSASVPTTPLADAFYEACLEGFRQPKRRGR